MERVSNEFFCPICGRPAEICVAARIRGWTRLDLPYFVCVNCSLVSYDKTLIRKSVSHWRNNDVFAKRTPFRIAYREAIAEMERIIKHRIKEMGYRFVRFQKKK